MAGKGSKTDLPIHGQPPAADQAAAPGNTPKLYVTLEEKLILDAMRQLRSEAESVRARLAQEAAPALRERLQEQLEELRRRRRELVQRREAASRRKMIMLGHIEEE